MPCAAMPPWGGYDSYTGPGGTTADGLIRQCSMLKVRSESLMAGYNEWHAKVWPEQDSWNWARAERVYSHEFPWRQFP